MKTRRRILAEILLFLGAGLIGTWALLMSVVSRGHAALYGPLDQSGVFLSALFRQAGGKDYLFALGIFIAAYLTLRCVCGGSRLLKWLYRWRFLLAAALLILCVLLEINNTSLYEWTHYGALSGAEGEAPIWGVSRQIRSDEWAVWSAFNLAQDQSGYAAVNDLIAGGGIDPVWISIGGLPAFSLAALLKPLYWGFLVLGAAKGYSFLFAMRLLLLFLVSFETAKHYTQNNQALSLTAAVMLTFSPYVQWWFSQSVAEVLIFGQGMVLCALKYVHAPAGKRRLLWAVLFAWCLGCYAMISYISWLISAAYFILPLCVLILAKHRTALKKKDIILLLLPLLAVGSLLALLISRSWETLMAVKNSVYPGDRLVTGGDPGPGLSSGLFSALLPFIDPAVSNSSECAGWITFAPAGLVLALIHLFKKKRMDALTVVLIVAELALCWFAWLGIPAWLAKITLLYQVNRPELAIGAADTVLLIHGLSQKEKMPVWSALLCGAGCAGVGLWMICSRYVIDGFAMILLAVLGLAAGACIFLGTRKDRQSLRVTACMLMTAALLGGAFVNPLQRGLDCVNDLTLVQELRGVEDEKQTWLVEADWPMTNLPLLAGKRTVNSTQPYPNTALWSRVDADGSYADVYNRFCHVSAVLTEDETRFDLLADDHMLASLRMADLETLGVSHVMTRREYPGTWQGYRWIEQGEADGYHLYRLEKLAED